MYKSNLFLVFIPYKSTFISKITLAARFFTCYRLYNQRNSKNTIEKLRILSFSMVSSQRFQDPKRMKFPVNIPPLINLHTPLKLLKHLIGQKKGI